MPYTVRITRRALREIDEVLGWLTRHSPAGASRWYRRLREAIESLQDNPGRCPLAPENEWYSGGELRQLLHGKRRDVYCILFEIRGTTVYILRVRHAARDVLGPDEL
jgi:plasmid stabilization system protein ParE